MRVNAQDERLHIDHVPGFQVSDVVGEVLVKEHYLIVGQPVELRPVIDFKTAKLGGALQIEGH